MYKINKLEGLLNMNDVTVRYFLRRPTSRGRIPKNFLGKNQDGSRRTQREARAIGSRVRQALRIIQDQELFMKAEAKRESQERAKQDAERVAKLEAELAEMKVKQIGQRQETIKVVAEKHRVLKVLKKVRLGLVKACASKPKPDKAAPKLLFKADGRSFIPSSQVTYV